MKTFACSVVTACAVAAVALVGVQVVGDSSNDVVQAVDCVACVTFTPGGGVIDPNAVLDNAHKGILPTLPKLPVKP